MVQTGFLSHCRAPLLLRSRAPLPRRPRRRGPAAADPQAAQAAAAHDPAGGTHRCRVLAVSDLHVDYPENLEWCRGISSTEHRHDVLIVAGDVSDDLGLLEEALGTLRTKFGWVFYVVGNHEVWLRQQDVGLQSSLAKLQAVEGVCAALDVRTAPARIGAGLWVVPIVSWHHRSFDQEPDIPGIPPVSRLTIADYAACRWPSSMLGGAVAEAGALELAEWFDGRNDPDVWGEVLRTRGQCDVVSFSHFLPSQALLPEKRFLYYPNLPKAVGSLPVAERVQQLCPDIHIFGHTHFAWDATIDGVRYIQAPLCSPLERHRRLFTVGFESSMAEAQADPEAAAWLPLQVYECQLSTADLPGYGGGSSSWGSWAGRGDSVLSAAGSVEGTGEALGAPSSGGSSEEEAGAIDRSMHGITTDTEEEGEILPPDTPPNTPQPAAVAAPAAAAAATPIVAAAPAPPPPAAAAESTTASRSVRGATPSQWSKWGGWGTPKAAHSMDSSSVAGPVQLRHGWMPPNLGAHWSAYYETHERNPSCLELAPWVARVYERRMRRERQKQGGSAPAGVV